MAQQIRTVLTINYRRAILNDPLHFPGCLREIVTNYTTPFDHALKSARVCVCRSVRRNIRNVDGPQIVGVSYTRIYIYILVCSYSICGSRTSRTYTVEDLDLLSALLRVDSRFLRRDEQRRK